MIRFFPSRTVAIEILGFAVHWYGLLYLLGFACAWVLLPRLQRLRQLHLSRDEWGSLLSWAVVGVILGGRIGYVLFYDPAFYLANPLQILAVWNGGMSSHGGFVGVTLALLFALRQRSREDLWRIADVVTVPVAIGLALGRMGNFINQELYGIPTDLPWGMLFPGAELPRHPTQLYAVAKNLFIAAVCFFHLTRFRSAIPGRIMGVFLVLYGLLRFLIEFLRVPSHATVDLGLFILTRGQVLSVPVIMIGVWILIVRLRKV